MVAALIRETAGWNREVCGLGLRTSELNGLKVFRARSRS